jgi:hypothetical protein
LRVRGLGFHHVRYALSPPVDVREIKREKKNQPSGERCCVLGTLGSCFAMAETSFALLLRFSPPLALDSAALAAGRDWPAARSLEPLSGLDGFEDEHRLWWQLGRQDRVTAEATAARDPDEVRVGEAVATTRRTEEGSMVAGGLVVALVTPQPRGITQESRWKTGEKRGLILREES